MKGLQQLFIILFSLFITLSTGACNLDVTDSGKGRIVLGDSSTIVTEHDSQYLEDAIIDLEDTAMESGLPRDNEDNFNNVAKAQQLAKQQQQDSIAKVKAEAENKKDEEAAAKKKEDKRKQDDKKKNVKDKKQTASQKKKAEEEKKKKRRR